MYKNQLQELAQRSCFNLPAYACIREGPDHAPRFKASVNFNGEVFEGTSYSTTLRQAEHAAAEVALNSLSARGPSRSLTRAVPNFGPVFHSSKENEQRENQSRVIRRRDYKGKMQRTHIKQNNLNNPTRIEPWKIQDPNPDGGPESSRPKPNSIFSMLPPPPARTMSKILPPDLSELKQFPQRDDDLEWIKNLSDAIIVKKPVARSSLYGGNSVYGPFFAEDAKAQKISSVVDPTHIAMKGMGPVAFPRACHHQFPERVAPAVQIRSVVPVCAAPPVRQRPTPQLRNQVAAVHEVGSSSPAELASAMRKLKL